MCFENVRRNGGIYLDKKYDKIAFEFESAWENITPEVQKEIFLFAEKYKEFLNHGKTERECIKQIIQRAKEKGYQNIQDIIKDGGPLSPGTKIYANNRGKSAALFVIGKEPIEKGMHIVGTHVDAPRLDLKPFPLYQDGELAFLKTHYYGGIKKYQWTTIPLALHGFIINKEGKTIEISIGESEEEPVFYITDLLPHLAEKQYQKNLKEGITGEELNVLVGSIPYREKDIKNPIKYNILQLLHAKYGIEEKDFLTAEIEVVPAGKARDIGFDKGLIGAYGQDDRVCSYSALMAIFDVEEPNKTVAAFFVDKEEIGSVGNTSMQSRFFENVIAELIAIQSELFHYLKVQRSLTSSKVLSGDVGAAFDPNFPEVFDQRNTAFSGKGVLICKYTGARGKSETNDANAEFLAEIRKIFEENHICWQIGELGKVDAGGGGTIAYIFGNYGADVVDCGTPVLSMHAPMEVVSKVDLYMTYKAYQAFFNASK